MEESKVEGDSHHSAPRKHYHVFLSFRGKDTRRSFTDHLYAALLRKGIVTFKDDKELERGRVISEELMKAIEGSLFAIVILSENYSSSSWCLDELQKIVEFKEDFGLIVFPVFHGVNPSDIRHQKGKIGKAFEKHEAKFAQDKEKVQRWKKALTLVSNFGGWDTNDRHEADIIEEIVAALCSRLCVQMPSKFDHLVGIQSKVKKMMSLLRLGLDDKCFVGLWGMGGIGKTALAKAVYETIKCKFNTYCFLANIREESERIGLVGLQRKLLSRVHQNNIEINDSDEGTVAIRHFLSNEKVLIVLDDVSHINQLDNLVGDKDWFGDGTRIVVTTRDLHLLVLHGQFTEYKIRTLSNRRSLKLLCQKAFKKDEPEEGYRMLSEKIVEYCGGLPLALQVSGWFLCKRSQREWRDTLNMVKQNLHKDVLKTLQSSYDELEYEEHKAMFLDIACFFKGKERVEVMRILENCGLHPTIGIDVLIEKSLISPKSWGSGKGCLHMHVLLEQMGKSIVMQESPKDASRRSRLWSREEADNVLKGNNGTEAIQSIVLNLEEPYMADWHPDCFSNMSNLTLLYLSNVHILHCLNFLPSSLKVLIWDRYPLEALPHNINQLGELVELTLHQSKIKQLWNGTQLLGKLKLINLSYSEDLIQTPDFNGVPNLECLLLEGCKSLFMVHESLGQHKKLVKLNLKDCTSLRILPRKLEMNSLVELLLSGCSKLQKLPKFGENMKNLSTCDVSETNIRKVPFSIIHLTNLKELSLHGYKGPYSFSLSGFSSLKKLDLSFCNLWNPSIPHDLRGLSSLIELDLRGNQFSNLPSDSISNLLNLERLYLSDCARLQSLPKLSPNLIRIFASCCPSMKPLKDMQHLVSSLVCKCALC
ncbi:disease resistance protein Roq1-like isoform X2 [Prosopis cineraria]|uniref:disease resistance protein Roq1-like isoform X2 n=1 Tax=Prosopis cineraria TaxID=364024 RepID=UPI00240F0749|nr:disease resistance protein Roq1-like isoform X2 [Prosopis cineraria]